MTQYLSDGLIVIMYDHWRETTGITFKSWIGIKDIKIKRIAITHLENEHPRVWQRIRSSAGNS